MNSTETISKNGFSRNLAFIIGINNYKNGIYTLKTAVNDAKKLVEILREKHGYQVWICLDEVATLNNLNQLLEKTLPEQVSENDRLLFYFAGHGVALNGDDGPAGYLIPQDAKQGDTNSYLPMTKLHDALSKLSCRHFLGIFDCCFAGAFRWSSTRDLLTTPEVIHKERYDRFITDPAWQILTSSASDQKALDNFKLDTERGQIGNHSPFGAALLEALEGEADTYPPAKNGKPAGDGVITATELYLHLRDTVEIPTEECNLRQTPGIWCLNKHDKGEYIFLSPGHELNLPPAPPLDESKNPYRGLNSFDEEHSEFFFGRSELVKELQGFIKNHPLTIVLGASGSGKSSLVKAGLIPKLRTEANEKWRILSPIRPGETPFQALNNALDKEKLPQVDFKKQKVNLAQSIDVWAKNNPNSKLLIVIDQSEELITLCKNDNERKEFFQQILTAINAHRDKLRVVLTLRSDFEPQVRDAGLKFMPEVMNKLGHTELSSRWQSGRFKVPAMTRSELREAIEKPAETRVMYFEPHELVEELIDEVDNMPGALPLLSFALSELFLKYLRKQRNAQFNQGKTIERAITKADYEELGGVMRSLTQRADEEYLALVKTNSAYEQVIRHVMLRMVALTGGELARRRVPLSELNYPEGKKGLADEVIKRFSAARLLVEGQDNQNQPYVEPAHDALVRGWEKLRNWLEEEKNLELQRRLTPAAFEWDKNKEARFLWNANPYLDVLNKEVLNSTENNWLNKVEAEFVRLSINRRKRNSRMRWVIAASVILGLSGLIIWAFIEQRKGVIEQIKTSRQASETGLSSNNLNLDIVIQSLKAAKSTKSWLLELNPPEKQLQEQVTSTLRRAVYLNREQRRWQIPQDEVVHTSHLSKDSKLTLTTKTVGTKTNICIWELEKTNKQCQELPENFSSIATAKFSPDGRKIAWKGEDSKSLYIWDLDKQRFYHLKRNLPSSLFEFRFSPNSKKLVFLDNKTQEEQSSIYEWNWENDNKQPKPLLVIRSRISNFNFKNDNGNLLVTTINTNDNTTETIITMWEQLSSDWKKLDDFPVGFPPVDGSSISPNGRSLVMTSGSRRSAGGFTDLWTNGDDTPTVLGRYPNFTYSSNGEQLAVVDHDDTILLHKGYPEPIELKGHKGLVSNLSFSQDSKQLLTVGSDNTIRLWDTRDEEINAQDFKQKSELLNTIERLSFSPDSKQVATLESGIVHLRDVSSGKSLKKSRRKYDDQSQLFFHPQGKQIAIFEHNTTGNDAAIHLLDLSSGDEKPLPGKYDSKSRLSFSPDGEKLAIIEQIDDGSNRKITLHLLNLITKEKLKNPSDVNADLPDGRIWTSHTKRNKQLLDVDATSPIFINNVYILDSFSKKELASLPIADHRSVQGISFNNNRNLASIDYGQGIYSDSTIIWDWQNNQSIKIRHGSSDANKVKFTKISPDASILAVIKENKVEFLELGGFDKLVTKGCQQVRDYLATLDDNNGDRNLCN
ncbi:MAG: caspase family protein [Rivularia sp. (in: cyanobacteria)]